MAGAVDAAIAPAPAARSSSAWTVRVIGDARRATCPGCTVAAESLPALGLGDDLSPLTGLTVCRCRRGRRSSATATIATCRWALGRPPLLHGGEGRRHVAGRAAGQAGMDADRGIEIGIGRAHDGGRRAARRQAGDVDPARIDGESRMTCRVMPAISDGLAPVALLVGGAEPVPAFLTHWRPASAPDRRPGSRAPRPARSSACRRRNRPATGCSRAA